MAEELEADWSDMRFEQAPADPAYANPQFGFQGTFGSLSVRAYWAPLRTAGAAARLMLVAVAAQLWSVPIEECRASRGHVVHVSGKSVRDGELAPRAALQPVPARVTLKDPAALHEAITIAGGAVEQSNFHDYRVLRIGEAPHIDVHILDSREQPGGVGEAGTPPIAPAIANALFALTGERIRQLPLRPTRRTS